MTAAHMPQATVEDSDALGYLQSQLEYVEAKVWEKRFGHITYQDLIPVSFEASEWAESIAVHYTDSTTEGRFTNSGGDDIPFARIGTGRDQVPVNYGGIGYEYSLDDLRKATALNRPLNTMSAEAARRGYEEHAQRIAYLGDADRGTTGLLNRADVPTGAAASTIAVALASGTPGDSVAAIINELLNSIIETTKEIHLPNRLVLPIDIFNLLSSTRLSAINETSILDYISMHNAVTSRTKQPLDIRTLPQLSGKMLAYESSEDVMVYHIPLVLRFIAPQMRNLMVRVPGEYKLAGLEMRFPLACGYRTGL